MINACFGGFNLSELAVERLKSIKSVTGEPMWDGDRCDRHLLSIIELLGSEKVSGPFAALKIVEIPDDVVWEITEYDGYERVEEVHRSWE